MRGRGRDITSKLVSPSKKGSRDSKEGEKHTLKEIRRVLGEAFESWAGFVKTGGKKGIFQEAISDFKVFKALSCTFLCHVTLTTT